MNGIKMSDCDFYVNEDKQTVVCVIPNTEMMLLDYIKDNFSWRDVDMSYAIDSKLLEELYMPKSFVGRAVCAEGDEWDEDTGCLIAFSRAKDKCYHSFYKRANKYVQTIDRRLGDIVESFNVLGVKLEDKRSAINAEIKALLGETADEDEDIDEDEEVEEE